MKPNPEEIPEFYRPYIHTLPERDLVPLLQDTLDQFNAVFRNVTEENGAFRYQKDKWSIKEIVQHLIDGERVFTYRALRFSRGDKTDLPGFEQDDYVAAYDANARTLSGLVSEFKNARRSTIDFFTSLNNEDLSRSGTASGFGFTANSIGYISAGHLRHHLNILEERYIPNFR